MDILSCPGAFKENKGAKQIRYRDVNQNEIFLEFYDSEHLN